MPALVPFDVSHDLVDPLVGPLSRPGQQTLKQSGRIGWRREQLEPCRAPVPVHGYVETIAKQRVQLRRLDVECGAGGGGVELNRLALIPSLAQEWQTGLPRPLRLVPLFERQPGRPPL